jgi:hypothetical protein
VAQDNDVFWNIWLDKCELADLQRKYLQLAVVPADLGTPSGKTRMQTIARQWPGALRELELIGAERCAFRSRILAELTLDSSRRAAEFLAIGAEGIVLAWMLHKLIRDILNFRSENRSTDLDAFLTELRGPQCERWPHHASRLRAIIGDRIDTKSAYLWLADWAKIPVSRVYEKIFERANVQR